MAGFHSFLPAAAAAGKGFRSSFNEEEHILQEQQRQQQHLELYCKARDAALASELEASQWLRTVLEKSRLTDFQSCDVAEHHRDGFRDRRRSCFSVWPDFRTLKEFIYRKGRTRWIIAYAVFVFMLVLSVRLPCFFFETEHQTNSPTHWTLVWQLVALIVFCGVFSFLHECIQLSSSWSVRHKRNWIVMLLGVSSILLIWGIMKLSSLNDMSHSYYFGTLVHFVFSLIACQFCFCANLTWRVLGFAIQALAIEKEGKSEASPILFDLFAHSVGLLIGVVLDRDMMQYLFNSLHVSLGKYVAGCSGKLFLGLADQNQVQTFRERASCLLKIKICRQYNNSVPLSKEPIKRSLHYRALGGFAGGFAGVSGLKSIRPVVIPKPVVQANNAFTIKYDLSYPSLPSLWPYSFGQFIFSGLQQSTDDVLSTSIGSCLCIDSDIAESYPH